MNLFTRIFEQPLYNALVWLYNVIPGHSLGVAIILLTIAIRVLLYPLGARALRSQRKLQALQPEIAKLRELHKGDPQGLNKATMELYKEREVSPFSSCLPALVQAPFLFALFFIFRSNPDQHFNLLYPAVHASGHIDPGFLWFNLFKRDALYILPIIAAALQYWQAKMVQPKHINTKDPAQAASRQMVYIFPVMTFIFGASLPAALPLYWITQTGFLIVQQRLIMRHEVEVLEESTEKVEIRRERLEPAPDPSKPRPKKGRKK